MDITYKREMKHNYLIIEVDQEQCTSYECKMLVSNCIDGLLRFRMKYLDSKQYFYYEVTSKQPLCRILENRCITLQEIRQLLMNLIHTLNEMEAYLLKEEQIFLEPEYIYVEPESFLIYLCLIPGRVSVFPDCVSKLLQYILGKVNHQDKECVVLAYGLYQESLKENYGIEDLMKLLTRDKEPPEEEAKDIFPDRVISEHQKYEAEGVERNPVSETPEQPRHRGAAIIAGFCLTVTLSLVILWLLKGRSSLYPFGIWLIIMNIMVWLVLLVLISIKKEVVKPNTDLWKMTFEEEGDSQKSQESILPTPERDANRSFEQTEGADTVLLVNMDENLEIKRLISLRSGGVDIALSYFPFIIGKSEGLVDYTLAKETVSRIHVKIDQECSEYKVTDLNSTNGTTVRGHLLEANETTDLMSGDEIYIADIGFRFI